MSECEFGIIITSYLTKKKKKKRGGKKRRMDLGMSREVQVSMPIPSGYPSIHDSSSSRLQIYNKTLGVGEGMSPPEDLRSHVRPHVPTRPSVVENMRTHPPVHYTEESRSLEINKPVRYRECRKNHAATMGGYAVDGCGEFMPSGDEGTPAALKCAACNCHRNFHRREVEGESRCDCHHTLR